MKGAPVDLVSPHRARSARPCDGWRATSIGWRVALHRPCSGSVHSVFPHAVNCLVDGQLWTILNADAPDAPLGLRLVGGVMPGDLGVGPGDPVQARAGFIALGPAVLDCRYASRWVPAPLPPWSDGWPERFEHVGLLGASKAWSGSAHLVARLGDALLDRPASSTLQDAVNRAVGCGPGLTPAGDDVLVGLFAGLWLAVPSTENRYEGHLSALRSRLTEAWEQSPSRTTDIGRHLLNQAAEGLFGAAVHNVLRAVAGPNIEAMSGAADALLATGATSGADTCVGLAACGPLLSRLSSEWIPQ